MRVEECPYRQRVDTQTPQETAACRLLEQLVAGQPESLSRVARDACEACCEASAAGEQHRQTVIASLAFRAAQEVIDAGGVEGCDASEAERLQRWSEAVLLRDAQQVGSTRGRRRPNAPCYYLGPPLGGLPGVFECHHADHAWATFQGCTHCADWLPRMKASATCRQNTSIAPAVQQDHQQCAVAVFAECSSNARLEWCIASLDREGWRPDRLFVEPGVVVPAEFQNLPVTQVPSTLTRLARFRLAGAEMYLRMPTARFYAFISCDQIMQDGADARRRLVDSGNAASCVSLSSFTETRSNSSTDTDPPDDAPEPTCDQLGLVWSAALLRLYLCEAASLADSEDTSWPQVAQRLAGWSASQGAPPQSLRHDVLVPLVAPSARPGHSQRDRPRMTVKRVSPEASDVAIVVPVWNGADHLPRCLESLRRQSLPAKLIVVDDASTDDTPQLLEAAPGDIVRIRHPQRLGANAARNSGIRATRRPFIAFADADNEYSETWLSSLLARVVTSDRTGVAFSGFTKSDANGRCFVQHGADWDVQRLWCNNFIDMSSVVRRTALPPDGLTEGFAPFDDWLLWLSMAAGGWIGACEPSSLFLRHVRPNGKTLTSMSRPAVRAAHAARIRRRYARVAGLGQSIAVVIPAHGCEDLTCECLTHLDRYCGVPFHVYYVDNGSPAPTVHAVEAHAAQLDIDLRVLRWDSNRGFTAAVNWGIRESAPADVLLVNNDCFVGPECIEGLALNMAVTDRVAACGPLTNDRGGQSLRGNRWASLLDGGLPEPAELENPFLVHRRLAQPPSACEVQILAFFCTLLNRVALDRIGPLDERFCSGLGADDEWCLRARAREWKVLVSLSSFARHLHQATFQRLQLDRDAMLRDSRELLAVTAGRIE